MNPHCRISKVRFKDAPHLAEIIPPIRGAEFRDVMHRHLDEIFDWAGKDGVAGVAVVAFDFKGHFNRATRLHNESVIGPAMLPVVVAEILRRDTSRDIAIGVLRGDE